MKMKSRVFWLVAGVFIALAIAAVQTINTVPSNNASFLTNLQAFLRGEIGEHNYARFAGVVLYGGWHTDPGASLTATIPETVAFPDGYYTKEDSVSHTYTASTDTYVLIRADSSVAVAVAGASISYDGTDDLYVFVEMTNGSTEPANVDGTLKMMKVVTDGTEITSVTDLRSGEVPVEGIMEIAAQTFDTVMAGQAYIGGRTITINERHTLAGNLTIPVGAHIDMRRGGYIERGSNTLTINAKFSASGDPHFDANVTFGPGAISYVEPEWWGENIVSGTTDMTTALQNAFDSLPATGGDVRLRVGSNYAISSELTCSKDGTRLVGYGARITGNNVAGYLIHFGNGSAGEYNMCIEGLRLDTEGTTTGAIRAQFVPNINIKNCELRGDDVASTIGILSEAAWIGVIEGCLIEGFDTGVKLAQDATSSYKSNHITIADNWFLSTGTSPFGTYGIHQDGNGTRCISRHNWFEGIDNASGIAIYIEDALKFTSRDDYFEKCTQIAKTSSNDTHFYNLTSGPTVTDGVEVDSSRNVITYTAASVAPTGKYYIRTSGSQNQVSIPTTTAAEYDATGGIIISSWPTIQWLAGNLFGSGTGVFYGFDAEVEEQTGNYTLDTTDVGIIFRNEGASGDITYTLPNAVNGMHYRIANTASGKQVTITPDTGDRIRGLLANESLQLRTMVQWIELTCHDNGIWDWVADSTFLFERTANAALDKAAMTDRIITSNRGAAGTVTITLPDAVRGLSARFMRIASQALRLAVDSGDQHRGASGVDKYLSMDSNGATVYLYCGTGGMWDLISSTGTISYEP